MKAILFIFLLSLVCCKTTLEKVSCIAKNDKVIEQVVKVIESFKNKNLGKTLQVALEAFLTVKGEVKKCLENEEPVLQVTPQKVYNPIALSKCKMLCGDYAYDYECNKRCEEQYGGMVVIDIDVNK